MANIVLATDGSDYAREAARRAVEMAAREGATLHVLCVVDRNRVGEPAFSTDELGVIRAEDRGHEAIEDVAVEAAEAGVPVREALRHGVPHEVVPAYADEIDADAIVLGAHGEHADHLGGVGRRIRDRTDREVVVVDRPVAE